MDVANVYPLLFHYTTEVGLAGILSSQQLRATHYLFLNDKQELLQLQGRMKTLIAPYTQKALSEKAKFDSEASEQIKEMGGLKRIALDEADAICRALWKSAFFMRDRPSMFDPFIVSFCSHLTDYEIDNGLLSQWRAYGGRGGYAIAFDTRSLDELLRQEVVIFAYNAAQFCDVVYDNDDAKFATEFRELIEAIPSCVPKNFYDEIPSPDALLRAFIRSVVRFKHQGFKEECEVRAVFPPFSTYWVDHLKEREPDVYASLAVKQIKPILFRDGFVPYIELFGFEDMKLPIKYIIVGPSRDQGVRTNRLRKFLELSRMEVEVRVSETPLV